MPSAPQPANEAERLAALEKFDILDTLPQQAFDDITSLASTICGTPIALISLVDAGRQWFKSRVGVEVNQTSREVAFCAHAILNPAEVMVVEDATRDARFQDNPLVRDAPDIRFYAGAPIVTVDGYAVGTVCVIDRKARTLQAKEIEALRSLSRMVVTLLEHDRTRRDEARFASAAEQRRRECLTAVATEGIDLKAFIDPDYVYQHVNHTFLDYWARRREEVEGRHVSALTGERVFRDLIKPHLDAALGGRIAAYEATFDFPSRGATHVAVTYLPARGAQGGIIGVVVRVHDIQKLKEREDQLRSTVAMLENKTLEQQRFIHIVSHDLREPINTIVNFSSLLALDHAADLPAAGRRYLDFVRGGGERMKFLLDDLLGFVRLENYVIDPRPVDLNRLMPLVRDDLAMAISRAGGRVEWDELPVVAGDESLLRIVLQNLVANGIKFARRDVPPVVRVSAAAAGGWHEIRVRDNGIGIPDGQSENVFDMFRRLHTRKQYEGSGLGLSICRRIAEMHAGRIAVAPEPGHGSCFSVSLPIAPPSARSAQR